MTIIGATTKITHRFPVANAATPITIPNIREPASPISRLEG